jgi:hypothetical protein
MIDLPPDSLPSLPQAAGCPRPGHPGYLADHIIRRVLAGDTRALPARCRIRGGIGDLIFFDGTLQWFPAAPGPSAASAAARAALAHPASAPSISGCCDRADQA